MLLFFDTEDHLKNNLMLAVYNKYFGFVQSTIRKYGIDSQEVENAIQSVFENLIVHAETLTGLTEKQQYAYIYQTARNVVYNQFKREKKYKQMDRLDDKEAFGEDPPDYENPIYESVENREKISRIKEYIHRLPERERDVMMNKFFLNKTDKEIAALLVVSEKSVRVYLTRAKRHLLKLWKEGERDDEKDCK